MKAAKPAKPLFIGSIPIAASNNSNKYYRLQAGKIGRFLDDFSPAFDYRNLLAETPCNSGRKPLCPADVYAS
jgi:hypothetical protein